MSRRSYKAWRRHANAPRSWPTRVAERGGNALFAASATLPVGDLGRVMAEHDLYKPSRATRTRRPATGADGAHHQVGHRPCVADRPLSPAKRLPPARKVAPPPAPTGRIDFSNGRWRRLGDPSWCMQQSVSQVQALEIANGVHGALADLLTTAQIELLPTSPFGGRVAYRARLGDLSANVANAACARLAASHQPCMVVAPGQAL